jgi:hypothetical protein
VQFFALVKLGVDALVQGLTLQVAQDEASPDELVLGLQHIKLSALLGVATALNHTSPLLS